jgi:3-deoxy-D-manno-octulosonic-acid transferase
VVILDTIGELRDVYALASVVFCGASLVPLGGQNVLEAAVWAKPVLFGPSMEDFEEARNLLEGFGGGICVQDEAALVDRALYLLTHCEEARRLGRSGKTGGNFQSGGRSPSCPGAQGIITDVDRLGWIVF